MLKPLLRKLEAQVKLHQPQFPNCFPLDADNVEHDMFKRTRRSDSGVWVPQNAVQNQLNYQAIPENSRNRAQRRPWFRRKRILLPAALLCIIALASQQRDDTTSNPEIAGPSQTEFSSGLWQGELEAIASSDLSKLEKQDAADFLAFDYTIDEDSRNRQTQYLIGEFESGDYLARLDEDYYALSNIFISRLIEISHADSDNSPVDDFAFDFYQITKNVYRGSKTVDSVFVQANVEQIQEVLPYIRAN